MATYNFNFQLYFDNSKDLLFIADQKGYFKKINQSVIDMFGFSEEELCAQPIDSFLHQEDIEKTVAIRKNLLKDDIIKDFKIDIFLNQEKLFGFDGQQLPLTVKI